jgi:hypothetical protein
MIDKTDKEKELLVDQLQELIKKNFTTVEKKEPVVKRISDCSTKEELELAIRDK